MFGIFGENVWQNTLASWRKRVWRFGENVFGDFGENLFGDFWRSRTGVLEKSFDDFGENGSAITLEIWRNVVGAPMVISYWSLL